MIYPIKETFLSINGETRTSGMPTTFIRFAGCNVRCNYCDSLYTYEEDPKIKMATVKMSLQDILDDVVHQKGCPRICWTGGEPSLYPLHLIEGSKALQEAFKLKGLETDISIEANGTLNLPDELRNYNVSYSTDLKVPSSGVDKPPYDELFEKLDHRDIVKLVVKNLEDLEWADNYLKQHLGKNSSSLPDIMISPVYESITNNWLPSIVEWLNSTQKWNWRLQIQIHKIIWTPTTVGV